MSLSNDSYFYFNISSNSIHYHNKGLFINHEDMKGEGMSQMVILLHKPYLVKWSTKGRGESKMSKKLSTWFMDDPTPQNSSFLVKFLVVKD